MGFFLDALFKKKGRDLKRFYAALCFAFEVFL